MLTSADFAFMRQQMAVAAPAMEEDITYRVHLGAQGGDAALGLPATEQFADEQTTATVLPITAQEVALSNGAYTLGETLFGVRRTTASNQDRIVYGGATWQPVEDIPARIGGQVMTWWMRCKRTGPG